MRLISTSRSNLVVARIGERAPHEHAGVRHEQIDPPEPLQRERDRGVAGCAVAGVGAAEASPRLALERSPACLVAATEADVPAGCAQPAHDRRADAAGAAGDERRGAHPAASTATVFGAQRGAHAAVDEQIDARDRARLVAREKRHGSGDVARVDEPAERRARPARRVGQWSRPATVVTMPGSVSPGQTALTRTPAGPASTASMRVSMISARFETE